MYTVSRLQAKQQLTALVSMATFIAVLDAQLLHGIRTQDGAVTYLQQRANSIRSEPAMAPSHEASADARAGQVADLPLDGTRQLCCRDSSVSTVQSYGLDD